MSVIKTIILLAASTAAFTLPARRVTLPARRVTAPRTTRFAEPVAEMTPEEKTAQEIANRKKISNALAAATKSRDKEQLQIT